MRLWGTISFTFPLFTDFLISSVLRSRDIDSFSAPALASDIWHSGTKLIFPHHFQPITLFFACPWQSFVCHYRSYSALRSFLGTALCAIITALCAIIDLIQLYARSLAQHCVPSPQHCVSSSQHCVPPSILFSFTLDPCHSIVCHHRSCSALRQPMAKRCVSFWIVLFRITILFSFTSADGKALCVSLDCIIQDHDLIQFYARPRHSLVCHYCVLFDARHRQHVAGSVQISTWARVCGLVSERSARVLCWGISFTNGILFICIINCVYFHTTDVHLAINCEAKIR